MVSIMPTSVQKLHQKATKKAQAKLHSFLCLPPPPAYKTIGKVISDDDSSSTDLESLVSSLVEQGTEIPSNLHPNPTRKTIILQASFCKHHYPVSPQSRAHRYYVHEAYTKPLCPHCDIAIPSKLPSASEEQRMKGKTTITATGCSHPITVRRRTAAIIAANPLIFSPSPRDDEDDDGDKYGGDDNDGDREYSHNEPWPGYTLCSSPHSLTLPLHRRKRIRVNLNVERCIACLKKEHAASLKLVTDARAELRNAEEEADMLSETCASVGMAGLHEAAAPGPARDPEWEAIWAGRVSRWRKRCGQLRLGLEVLEREREKAEAEEMREGHVGESQPNVDDAVGTKKRRGSVGSLKSLKSLSARSRSWGRMKGEMWRESVLKPALKKSTKGDVDAEDVVKKGPSVQFNSKSTAFGNQFRYPARFERKSTHYRPGKWARDGSLLDTSGFCLKTEKEIRDWHIPPEGLTVLPERD